MVFYDSLFSLVYSKYLVVASAVISDHQEKQWKSISSCLLVRDLLVEIGNSKCIALKIIHQFCLMPVLCCQLQRPQLLLQLTQEAQINGQWGEGGEGEKPQHPLIALSLWIPLKTCSARLSYKVRQVLEAGNIKKRRSVSFSTIYIQETFLCNPSFERRVDYWHCDWWVLGLLCCSRAAKYILVNLNISFISVMLI